MTEQEYIIVTNRKAITAALAVLRDVMPDSDYAVHREHYMEAMRLLREIEAAGFEATKISA